MKAVDVKNNSLLSTCNVAVQIVDTNDNDPIFEKPNYNFSVTENSCDNTVVGAINVSLTNEIKGHIACFQRTHNYMHFMHFVFIMLIVINFNSYFTEI